MKRAWLLSLLLAALSLQAAAFTPAFVENRGQWHADARYRLQLDGLTLWITDDGATYHVSETVASVLVPRLRGHVVRAEFVGASPEARVVGEEKGGGMTNYFIGADRRRWGRNCRSYGSLRIADLYDGIDAVYYLDDGRPRYDLIVAPGADPSRIAMRMRGADDVLIEEGRLAVGTSLGDLEMRDLVAYQINGKGERCQITSRFRLRGGLISFEVGAYDRSRPLVIDPIVYSTYIGGSGSDVGTAIAVDGAGSAYVAGYTLQGSVLDADYPTTPGAYDTTSADAIGDQAVITKLRPDGSGLIFSTYLGGGAWTVAEAIAVDAAGNVYVAGTVSGDGFPTTEGAFDTIGSGGTASEDFFVTKLSADGSTLLYSTLLKGNGESGIGGIAVDADGSAYVAGSIGDHVSFPVTSGAYRSESLGGIGDGFVTKLSPDGRSLIYSALIGGTMTDIIEGVAIDSSGCAYLVGQTEETHAAENDYPTTAGAYDTSHNGMSDLCITKLSADGSELLYSTVVGGGEDDGGFGIAVDRDGAAYVVGGTYGRVGVSYPTTEGAYGRVPIGNLDVVVSKLTPDGSELLYSTLIGGRGIDFAYAIAVDAAGAAVLSGFTTQTLSVATNYPVTEPFPMFGNGTTTDVFVTRLDRTGSAILYSAIFGGSADDRTFAVAVDADGNAYIAGTTIPVDANPYPTTEGAYSRTARGRLDEMFVTKLAMPTSGVKERSRARGERIDLN